MSNEKTTPEDEMMNKILYEIKRYENNQKEFKDAIEEFYHQMSDE